MIVLIPFAIVLVLIAAERVAFWACTYKWRRRARIARRNFRRALEET